VLRVVKPQMWVWGGMQAYNLLGYSYRSLTPPDMANALANYQLALTKNPNHCGVYEYLGACPPQR
jgi:hypothetical protein